MAEGHGVVTNESRYSKSDQGHSRSNDGGRCINCGHVSSSIVSVEAERVSAELREKQGSTPTHKSRRSGERPDSQGTADTQRGNVAENVSPGRVGTLQSMCGGHDSVSQDKVGRLESGCGMTPEIVSQGKVVTVESGGGGLEDVQGRVDAVESRFGRESTSQGKAVAVESRCGGRDGLKTESYRGVVSRQLCEQLLQLMSDVDTARDYYYNVQVLLQLLQLLQQLLQL